MIGMRRMIGVYLAIIHQYLLYLLWKHMDGGKEIKAFDLITVIRHLIASINALVTRLPHYIFLDLERLQLKSASKTDYRFTAKSLEF